ncbi:MAG TPA: 50S ribosomal protein L13 [Lentisphaeria bacterium]|nr:MAG: 50S ribosomal protein L13 [Lentisphaerae bacterium GWF2_38_69]HBM17227.1 50S ribosomal protein L13 [Lentisphaeria bacterium]
MKSYLAKPNEIERKYIVMDADSIPLGRLAVKIANALRGKDKPTYTPHVDTGSFVVVVNAEKVRLTGNKENDMIYQDYSGFKSGLKEQTAAEVRAKKPERLVEDAVWGMLPKGRLGRQIYRKLKVYAGPNHPHEAQQPQVVSFSK